jgi:glycosyltransferase involved in cell wall biosynthesis
MIDQPLVSVILPVYNGEVSIRQTLDSALCQTYRNIELIVVNDGSTDQTQAILETRAINDSRVQVFSQGNGGVACARNRGIAASRGEFICTLDADDIWDPTKIERQVSRLIQGGEGTGIVYSWWVWIDAEGAILDRSPRWTIEGEGFELLLKVNYTGNASVPMYRRKCLEQVGGYNEQLLAAGGGGCEDWDMALRVAERYRVAVVPELLVAYRRRPGSMSGACDTMWRSQQLVIGPVPLRRPDLKSAILRQSSSQFALHLAAISFWRGDYPRALLWGLRALPSRLPFLILPFVLRMLWKRVFFRGRRGDRQFVVPGQKLETVPIPGPSIPYDRFYEN